MDYKCEVCNEDITKAEFLYSIKNFDRPLCRKHQELEGKLNSVSNQEEQPISEEPIYKEKLLRKNQKKILKVMYQRVV